MKMTPEQLTRIRNDLHKAPTTMVAVATSEMRDLIADLEEAQTRIVTQEELLDAKRARITELTDGLRMAVAGGEEFQSHERILITRIAQLALSAGILADGHSVSGPQALQLCDDLQSRLAAAEKNAETLKWCMKNRAKASSLFARAWSLEAELSAVIALEKESHD